MRIQDIPQTPDCAFGLHSAPEPTDFFQVTSMAVGRSPKQTVLPLLKELSPGSKHISNVKKQIQFCQES